MKAKKWMAGLLSFVMLFDLTGNFASAAAAGLAADDVVGGYHYDQLNDLAKAIYAGIGKMDLQTGTDEYDLVGHGLDGTALPGSAQLNQAMNAARYAYYADHPELFYVDFPKLALRTTLDQAGSKHVYIGSGRNASYLVESFADKNEVETAAATFDARVSEIAAGAQAVTAAEGESLQAAQIKYVHNEIIAHVSYRLEDTAAVGNAPLLGTPYGVLVKKQGVCEGYARAFKTVMDRLGIRCILVQGVHQYDGAAAVSHMWNYVELTDAPAGAGRAAGGKWYAVDATLDDPEIPIVANSEQIREYNKYHNYFAEYGRDGFEQEKYLLSGQLTMNEKHFEAEEVAAAGGYRFAYPALEEYDFTVTDVSNDLDGFKVIAKDVSSSVVEGEMITSYRFSYLGMTASEARKKGIYLVWRYYKEENGEIVPYYGQYGSWFYLDPDVYALREENGFTTVQEGKVPYVEIAATTVPPEKDPPASRPYANLTYQGDDSGLIARTGKIYNKNQSKYTPPPFILRQTPTQTASIFISDKFYHITVEYDQTLKLAEGYGSGEEVGTRITCRSRLGAYVTGDQYSEIKNFHWDGDRTVEFDMKFSRMYADDNVIYNVYLEGLVGETSEKAPNPICYSAQQKIVCPSIMERNGSWDIFGKPTLLESDDLSMKGWETSNGQAVSDLLKDRLTLVTTKTTEKQDQQIAPLVDAQVKEKILDSATYNITLSVCKSVVVKTGHKVKVRMGFPEGYGPDDEGITYKAYHFMRDSQGNVTGVEEIGCVVTQYGLILTCDAFSPFMIAAVEKDGTTAEDRAVVVTTSDGGTVSGAGLPTSGIATLYEGGSQSLTFTAREGYRLESLTVCGRELEVTDGQSMTVTVGYDDVQSANNIVNANFVAQAVALKEAEAGQRPVKPTAEAARITMPGSKALSEGDTLTIRPAVAGQTDSVQTFQWYKDGVKLEGRIGKDLTVRDVTADAAGEYTLMVTTTVGTVSADSESSVCAVSVARCPHGETELRGLREPTTAQAGYTGDTYCKLCGRLVNGGEAIPRLSGSDSDDDTSDAVSYAVSVTSGEHGMAKVSPRSAQKGSTVTVTVKAEEGHVLDELTVLDRNGNALKLTKKNDTQYTFTMPEGKVRVEAVFGEIAAPESIAASESIVAPAAPVVEDTPSFADVERNAYCYDAVAWAVAEGITKGTGSHTFGPEVSCTRAQMVTFLWRAAGSPRAAGSNPFTDLQADAYYYDAVLWAVEQGITKGTSAATFAPDAIVTRAHTVTFLYRAVGAPAFSGGSFGDVAADAYYTDAVAWAVAKGITNGVGENVFGPDADCTRGQIVTFLYRNAR